MEEQQSHPWTTTLYGEGSVKTNLDLDRLSFVSHLFKVQLQLIFPFGKKGFKYILKVDHCKQL